MNAQSLIFEIIGYNFKFSTPFDAIDNFHNNQWKELKTHFNLPSCGLLTAIQEELYMTRKNIMHRLVLQIY